MSKLSELTLNFDLREWTERDFKGFKQATRLLDQLGKNVGIQKIDSKLYVSNLKS